MALSPAVPAQAEDGFAGAYLAARQAAQANDFREAAHYYTLALELEPDNPALLENGMMSLVGSGDLAGAVPLAEAVIALGLQSQIAHLVLLADDLAARRFAEVSAAIAEGRSAGPLVDGLATAWALLGMGSMSDALEAFDALADQPGMRAFALFHKALALASVGDFETAETVLAGDEDGPLRLTRRGLVGHLQILGQLERFDEALAIMAEVFGTVPEGDIAQMRASYEAGVPVPFDVVTSPAEGGAEVFFTLASVLSSDANDTFALLYSRLAAHLAPGHVDAWLLGAQLLEALGQYDLAIEAYGHVPEDHGFFLSARLGRVQALHSAERVEQALDEVAELAASHAGSIQVHNVMGDLLRREDLFEQASAAYSRAIDLIGPPDERHWVVFYTRGISHERQGLWPEAEADFRKALELRPDQPHVLNYLGYSLVERRESLDEALDMIERAVAGEPDNGYITDSLGWVLYRLGRYEEAVPHMERAVELLPSDAVINDHLGDVYWAVGRTLEARFQWRRALSFGPADDLDMDRIRRKLEVGLDQVLVEEGAAPHHPVQADGN